MRKRQWIGLSFCAFGTAILAAVTNEYLSQQKQEYAPEVRQEWVEYNHDPNDAERSLYIEATKEHHPFHLITAQDGSRVLRKEAWDDIRAPGALYVRFNDLESGVQEAIREASKDF